MLEQIDFRCFLLVICDNTAALRFITLACELGYVLIQVYYKK